MPQSSLFQRTQERFLSELRHHLEGWNTKVRTDLSQSSFEKEIKSLKNDPVYSSFGLATAEYALIRLMGRMSISIGRRLGEIYDKIPRFVTQARFGLDAKTVAPKIGGNLELDVCIPLSRLSEEDRQHVTEVTQRHLSGANLKDGLAIEIRYNFNPNDSARLRKDVEMAKLLSRQNFFTIYLIFSAISPREEAIARLKRAGWAFLVGDESSTFMNDLIGMDLESILQKDDIHAEIEHEVQQIMRRLYQSYAVRSTLSQQSGE